MSVEDAVASEETLGAAELLTDGQPDALTEPLVL